MPSDNFWKRIIVFSITLLVGIISAEFSGNLERQEIIENKTEILISNEKALIDFPKKVCVAENKTLKYQKLPFNYLEKNKKLQKLPYYEEPLTIDTDRLKGLTVQLENLESELGKLDKSKAKRASEIHRLIVRIQNEIDKTPKPLNNDDFNLQSHKLIHLENCLNNK